MKKLFLIFFLAAVVLIATSCKKDDPNSLAGTTWYCADEGMRITFTSASAGRLVTEAWSNDEEDETYLFSYTYSPPNISFTFLLDDGTETAPGMVDGNLLIVYDEYYTKQ